MALNFGSGLQGGLSGALGGATLGSVVPGIGTAIGAGAGGLLGLLSSLLGGSGSPGQGGGNAWSGYNSQNRQLSTVTDQQKQLMDVLGQLGLSGLGRGADFAPIAQNARQQFDQQSIPGIAERFSGLGAQNSSAFGQQLGGAAAGLESNLAGLQSQHNLGQQGLYAHLAQLGLGNQFENQYSPAQPGLSQQLPGQLLAAAPDLLRYKSSQNELNTLKALKGL